MRFAGPFNERSKRLKNRRYKDAGALAMMLLTLCAMSVFAAEVGSDAGVEKETVLSLIKKGGPIMIPLGLASLLALALGLERLISQSKERVMPNSFIDGLKKAWNGLEGPRLASGKLRMAQGRYAEG